MIASVKLIDDKMSPKGGIEAEERMCMLDLNAYIRQTEERRPNRAVISLSGKLEALIGNYYVSGEGGGNRNFHWLVVYYDPDVDTDIEAVEAVPSHMAAIVSSDYRWGFVLDSHHRKFEEDVQDYGMRLIPVADFESELLECPHTERLPPEFSGLVWLDDDFMDDERIPFD